MLRKVAGFTAVLVLASQLFAQNGGGNVVRKSIGTDGSAEGVYRATKLDRIASGSHWIYSGRTPVKYKMLNLTDEQSQAIDALVVEARDKIRELGEETRKLYQQTKDANVYKERAQKQQELQQTYETRILDVLTDDQKALLAKIEKLIEEQRSKIQEMYQELNKQMQKLREDYDKQLDGLLTPEQRKALDELLNPKPVVNPQGGPGTPVSNPPATGQDVAF
ncbi:MAG: hypothetical protein JW909_01150 [Planctomycetes bacterium]|nr:hypothetical protein [Planctomycetota bacterium]